jgi:protein-serine/threonine kinase
MNRNPQAVLDVLEFYTENLVSKKENNYDDGVSKNMKNMRMGDRNNENSNSIPPRGSSDNGSNMRKIDPRNNPSGKEMRRIDEPTSPKVQQQLKPLPAKPKKNPKEKDGRLSTMTESQIMQRLKSLVTSGDPNRSFEKIKKIGQGASGSVYTARQLSNNRIVAIKQMELQSQPRKELIVNEIIVMRDSQHPNIVNYIDSFLVKSELWVVMELMAGGPLTDVIDNNTMTEPQIAAVCQEVIIILL